MANWIHPDQLDRISSSTEPAGRVDSVGREQVNQVLSKVLITGALQRIPKNPHHRIIVLAMLCLGVHRRRAYSEREINEYLEETLQSVDARVDHVTCRRYLVETGFLKRDRAGARYLLNFPQLEAVLDADVIGSEERLLQNALEKSRRDRRRRSSRSGFRSLSL